MNESCLTHTDPECRVCPRYEWRIDWEHGSKTGFFWVGQDAGMSWGVWGDGITLTYRSDPR